MKIFIYGVGKAGKEFIQYVQELSYDIEIVAISDSNAQKAGIKVGGVRNSFCNLFRNYELCFRCYCGYT